MNWYRKGERAQNSPFWVYDFETEMIKNLESCDHIGLFADSESGEIYIKSCIYTDEGFFVDGLKTDDSKLICYTTLNELIGDARREFLEKRYKEVFK